MDLEPLKQGGVLDENPILKDGDVFVVPKEEAGDLLRG